MRKPKPRRLLSALAFLLPVSALGQQSYVGRYDIYSGFTYFDSPIVNLSERGYQFQGGINPKSWYSLGFDYSIVSGTLSITPNLLTTGLQQQLGGQLGQLVAAGLIPPTYKLNVSADSTTQTFAAGPQLNYRHFTRITLFIRPSIGAIHEKATPRATDAVTAAVIQQLAPTGKVTDWTPFYGFGGGVDINPAKHFSIRLQADYVHDHLFSNLLKDGRNTARLSVGPAFHFGKNASQ